MGAEFAEIRIAWADHAGVCIGRRGRYDLIQCEICGFRHEIPLPDQSRGARDPFRDGGPFRR
ncbi:MAG TPA: hypothetical protein VGB91_16425 [Rhizomicrobium sp.]